MSRIAIEFLAFLNPFYVLENQFDVLVSNKWPKRHLAYTACLVLRHLEYSRMSQVS